MVDLLTAGVAVASLLLSVYLYIKQRWERREASVTARLVRLPDEDIYRLVIVNHGPHHADEVDAVVQGRDGGGPRGVHQVIPATEVNELPLPRLHAGESYYLRAAFFLVLIAEPAQVELTWRDGRRGTQRKTVLLSVHPT
jgi:hypothetical protein